MFQRDEQHKSRGRADNCADGVHHPLEAEGAAVGFLRDGGGEQRLAHGRAHAAPEPRERPRNQDVPGRRRQSERRRAAGGDEIANDGDGFAALQFVGVKAGRHLGEAGQPVGDAFNHAQPCRRRAHGREKRGQDGGGDFVRPVAEQRRQPDAEDGAVEPALRLFFCRRNVHNSIEQQRNEATKKNRTAQPSRDNFFRFLKDKLETPHVVSYFRNTRANEWKNSGPKVNCHAIRDSRSFHPP